MNKKQSILDDIKKFIDEGEMSFLIGAGFSRNINKDAYPMWGDLLKDAVWNMFGGGNRSKQEKKVVDKAVKEYGYLGIASMMVKKAGFHEAIDTYIESKTPYIKTFGGKPVLLLNGRQLSYTVSSKCHLLLKNLNIQNIYTFNYDNALEYFMGEEAKQTLKDDISDSERRLDRLREEIDELKHKEASLKERMDNLSQPENNASGEETMKNLKQEIVNIQEKIRKNRAEINEHSVNLEKNKWNLRTYYNVVKDSCEISLSAKKKSIYKIHGSLRENASCDYGFDGDSHTQYIITQEDYETYNEKHGAFVSMMRIDLLRSRFCIMGVSGGDANFLAWIDWVKDVLDKTKDRAKQGKAEHHQSYFIYSGNDEMPEDLVLMLRNHYIEPVVLKDLFPKSKNNEQRIQLFLEYVQPLSNKNTSRFSELWKNKADTDELFRLSALCRFNRPQSYVQYLVTETQFSAGQYLKDGASRSERQTYAAALQSSLMPLDLMCSKAILKQMDKESDADLKKVFVDACRRAILLQHLSGKEKKYTEADPYTHIMYNLYSFRFPTSDEIDAIDVQSGIDFTRRYSLLKLLQTKDIDTKKCESSDFKSPQELVLASDWLSCIGYRNQALTKKAEDFKHQGSILSLHDYCYAYLDAMRPKEELNAYGDVTETVYLDKYQSDVVNGAALLNAFVELGICFAGQWTMADKEWLEIVNALKQRYPTALAFYTIARNGKDKAIKIAAQELMYDDISRKALPSVLKNIIVSLTSELTPVYLKGSMAKFASEILPSVNPKSWSRLFASNAEKILDLADQHSNNHDLSKHAYGFVAKALEYVLAKELRLRLLKRIFEKMDLDDPFGSYFNTLAISAREHLKPSDFAPLNKMYFKFAEKARQKKSQQAFFVIMNLLVLLDENHEKKVLRLIEDRVVRDPFLIGGYVSHIRYHRGLVKSFNEYFFKEEDLWNSGVNKDGIHIGTGNVRVSQLDKLLHFNDEQVAYIYNDLKMTLEKIGKVLQQRRHSREDKGWLSPENVFRELVMDMRLFVNQRKMSLVGFKDFEKTYNQLVWTYEQCFFGKSVLQIIADDDVYKAIRRIMTEVDLEGIDNYRIEYEQLIGRMIAKDSKDLGTLFQHISWAINHYDKFFDTPNFNELLKAVLKVYQPFFDISRGELPSWQLKGCQKEVAEKALLSISKTMEKRGLKDVFWSHYKRVFHQR